ncbi:hypothetical protein HBI23_257360 [Parastagonospora nodorum]|nr:hypothetical protein HBI23_257360 [Parastagonospora nodorum]KAH5982826.1 hypothetical protein HBI84_250200 [Parastagonospora nodorum]KAH6132285.1 hypothetical protein HBI68_255720 [Parastagonospora nodorum]KAH6380401.1 hypothetical protein HBI08_242090 [Parastagonospora nodorum]KAH6382944.1 hypothetical protein HBI60_259330 [Parastagonospora nodorum]
MCPPSLIGAHDWRRQGDGDTAAVSSCLHNSISRDAEMLHVFISQSYAACGIARLQLPVCLKGFILSSCSL